jgi:hypothetical protein
LTGAGRFWPPGEEKADGRSVGGESANGNAAGGAGAQGLEAGVDSATEDDLREAVERIAAQRALWGFHDQRRAVEPEADAGAAGYIEWPHGIMPPRSEILL